MTINKLDDNGYWAVDGVPIYVPATPCKIDHSNIAGSSTGRDESGVMHIDWVRRDVRKVYLTYGALTGAELDYLLSLMQGKEFSFTFLDGDDVRTMQAYVGESSYESYSYALGDRIYTKFSMNVIEL